MLEASALCCCREACAAESCPEASAAEKAAEVEQCLPGQGCTSVLLTCVLSNLYHINHLVFIISIKAKPRDKAKEQNYITQGYDYERSHYVPPNFIFVCIIARTIQLSGPSSITGMSIFGHQVKNFDQN